MGHLPKREVCYMRRHIDFDKIGITDDVMFCTVLSNSEDCREFLQRILGIEIEEIVVNAPKQGVVISSPMCVKLSENKFSGGTHERRKNNHMGRADPCLPE